MPKLIAPHPATWRGRALEIAGDGTVEVPDEAVDELAAHGIRTIEDVSEAKTPIAAMSRKELIAFIRENGGGNAVTRSNAALREAAEKIAAQRQAKD